MTQMAMTQNFVWITTDDTEGDYLEFKQYKEHYNVEKDKQQIFLMTGRRY